MQSAEPADIVRNVAGQMIHTKIYKGDCKAAFPVLMANYNLGMLPDPDEAITWIKSGNGSFGYKIELRICVDLWIRSYCSLGTEFHMSVWV